MVTLKQVTGKQGEFVGPEGDEMTSYGHFYIMPDNTNTFGVIVNHSGFATSKQFTHSGDLYMCYGFKTEDAAMQIIQQILEEIKAACNDPEIHIE